MKKTVIIVIVILIVLIGIFLILRNDIMNGINVAFKSLNYKEVETDIPTEPGTATANSVKGLSKYLSMGTKISNNSILPINAKNVTGNIYNSADKKLLTSDIGDVKVKSRQTKIIYIPFKNLKLEDIGIMDLINVNLKGYYGVVNFDMFGRTFSSGKLNFNE